MVTAIEGAGTAEAVWLPWLEALAPPVLPPPARPLVVAPHPDDEVLGAGGLLALSGGDVVVVTDGAASHPDVPDLAAVRAEETAAALAVLGAAATVRELRQPDGAVDEPALAAVLLELLAPGDTCLVTWRGDGHPDHEAAGRAAALACARRGARLLEYPIWAWHWAEPGDPRVPWATARRLDLPPAVRAAKAAALREFRTQLPSILPPHVLARFERPYEIVFAAGSA